MKKDKQTLSLGGGSMKKGCVDDLSSSGVGQVQLPADTTTGFEYQLDSVVEVGHDH